MKWTSVGNGMPAAGVYVVAAVIADGEIKRWARQRFSYVANKWLINSTDYGFEPTHWAHVTL